MFGNLHNDGFSNAIINNTFAENPPEEVDVEEWKIAREWHTALIKHNVLLPGSMRGHEAIHKLESLEDMLCPVRLYYPFLLGRYTSEEHVEMRAAAEKRIVKFLEEQGY
jgi:hypothetical protein